jgi:hypothetical protein
MATLINHSVAGRFKIEASIIETNGNALKLTITQPADQAFETTHLFYMTDLDKLEKFAVDLLTECRSIKQKQ